MRTARSAARSADHSASRDVYAAAVSDMLRTCRAASEGDLEARAVAVPDSCDVPELAELRIVLNRLLDRTDAYVRESAASLEAASTARFHRRFLLGGTLGVFRNGAVTINRATETMAATQAQLDEAAARRLELADRLEQTVATVAEQMAAAATELSATAAGLTNAAHHATNQAQAAGTTVEHMEQAAGAIQDVVSVISTIASQTRLLALNATIEATRAGDSGAGFAVVASEVKALADSTATSTEQITEQITRMHDSARDTSVAVGTVARTVHEMSPMADAVSLAVDGSQATELAIGAGPTHGLAEMAELLRAEVGSFLAELRDD